MNENIKSNYYAIIPAVVRYDKDLTDKQSYYIVKSLAYVIKKVIVLLQTIILQTYIIVLLEQYNLRFPNCKKKAI